MLNAETAALVNVVREGTKGIYSVALAGDPHWQPLIGGERAVSLQDADDKRMLFLSSTLENPGELCIANLDGSEERQITQVNSRHIAEIAFPKSSICSMKTRKAARSRGGCSYPAQGNLLIRPFSTSMAVRMAGTDTSTEATSRCLPGPAMPCYSPTRAARPAMAMPSQPRYPATGG